MASGDREPTGRAGPAPLRRLPIRVLLVDDDRDLCERIVDVLGPRGFQFTLRASAESAMAMLETAGASLCDVVVANVGPSGRGGPELWLRIAADFPDLPVVLMTASGSLDMAVPAIRAGVFDIIRKPFEINVLALALDRLVCRRRAGEAAQNRRETVEIDGLIGTSPAMRRVHDLIDRVAASDAPVLIRGESGTGKELVARALHGRGRRGNGPFVAVSCGATRGDLLESELFGHVEGAVAGGLEPRRGRLLEASGGTVFLDEITGLGPGTQFKLERVLQERVVRPIGGDDEEPYDARLLTATDRDLETEVEKHRFREDLFYRVRVIQIDVPSLRARGNDVLLLAQHFIARAAEPQRFVRGISSGAAAKLLAYPWPGNVRELENCIAHAVALARTPEILVDDLPDSVRNHHGSALASPDPLTLESVERHHILRVLAAVGGSKAAAAEVLGLHPSTLYRKLEHYGHMDAGAAAETPELGDAPSTHTS